MLIVKKDGKWGVCTLHGTTIMAPLVLKRENVLYYLGSLPSTACSYLSPGSEREYLVGRINAAMESSKAGLVIKWSKYDAEKAAVPFTSNLTPLPVYYLDVPAEEGPAFMEAITYVKGNDILQTASFFLYQDFAQIAELTVTLPSGKTYHYRNPGLDGYAGPIVKFSDLY